MESMREEEKHWILCPGGKEASLLPNYYLEVIKNFKESVLVAFFFFSIGGVLYNDNRSHG